MNWLWLEENIQQTGAKGRARVFLTGKHAETRPSNSKSEFFLDPGITKYRPSKSESPRRRQILNHKFNNYTFWNSKKQPLNFSVIIPSLRRRYARDHCRKERLEQCGR